MTVRDEPGTQAGARRVVLARHRPDPAEQADHTVHLIAVPLGGTGGEANALCRLRMRPSWIETVSPGEGVWCTLCFVCHVTGSHPAPHTAGTDSGAGCGAAALAYRTLGWPVTVRRDHVSLNLDLDLDAVALVLPAGLGSEVAEILVRRRCPPPVLVHPSLPAHRIILAGERFCVPLTWPAGVHRVTGTLQLPPTVTAHGPIRWIRPPQPHALKLCREFDVCAALSTVHHNPPPPCEEPDRPGS
ncbi:MAG: hypothetical protein ACRDTE_14030 [Pseudonocardiaceae bacterium]